MEQSKKKINREDNRGQNPTTHGLELSCVQSKSTDMKAKGKSDHSRKISELNRIRCDPDIGADKVSLSFFKETIINMPTYCDFKKGHKE